MKISMLKQLAGVFLALVLGTTTLFSQGRQNGFRWNNSFQQGLCINQLNDLTDQQRKTIDELKDKHFSVMAELREKRVSAANPESRISLRDEMLESILVFRKDVYGVLNPAQQKQFDLINLKKEFSTKGNFGTNNRMGNGNNQGNGFCRNGNGRGNGNGCSNRPGRFRQGSCRF